MYTLTADDLCQPFYNKFSHFKGIPAEKVFTFVFPMTGPQKNSVKFIALW